MHALLITIGSHGDVHPFIGLGLCLKQRGHRVTIVTNPHFQALIERVGLEFIALDTAERFTEALKNPDLWHPIKGFKTVMQWGVLPLMRPTYEIIRANYVPGETIATIVVASSLAFGARIAEEKLGVPTATVHLSPAIFRSSYEPPKMPGLFMPRWLPVRVKDAMWWIADKAVIDPVLAPELNKFRKELGLPPVTRILNNWWHSPRLTIGMFPEFFAPPQPDWPRQVKIVGFPLYDERGVEPLSRELEEFLSSGDAPIAFTPGSANIHGREFFEAATAACQKINRRGLLLTRHIEQIPRDLPPTVRHFTYAPFSELLPRCAALVHHGGIGTTAQALAAQTPQLIMPLSHDQFDNAARVQRLGAGLSISSRRFAAKNVARLLDELLHSKLPNQFAMQDGVKNACDLLEKLNTESPQMKTDVPSAA